MEKTRLPFERLGSTVVFPRTSTNIDSTRICIHDIGRGRRKKFKVTPPNSTPKSNQPSEKKETTIVFFPYASLITWVLRYISCKFNLLGAAPQDTGGAVGCDLVQTDLNGKSF